MKSRSRCLLLLLLTLQLPLVHEVDQVLPHQLLDGDFLLLDIVVFLDLLLLKGQVFQIRINSVGNEEILHLGDDFFEVFDFLQF